MFNPRPHIERVPLGGAAAVWVVDDVLVEPESLCELAVRHRARFQAAPFNAYPGLEWPMRPDVSQPLLDFFTLHLRGRLGARRTLSMHSRLSLATLQASELQPLQRLCHRDRFGVADGELAAACTLYLFKDAALGGTAFYTPLQPLAQTNALMQKWHAMDNDQLTHALHQAPGYIAASNGYFELTAVIPPAFNRAVFHDGNVFHSSHITRPECLSPDPAQGRLTLNGFFVCRRTAAAA